ncbi:MAG TPA: hypothetical protein VF215_15535, partial [Thermoanaerobaculia bacterium]
MSSTVARWAGRWESEASTDAFERFLEELVARVPAHVRITRAATEEADVLLSPTLVDIIGDPELVASSLDGRVLDAGRFAGCVAVDHVRLRGYEISLSTGTELARFSFQTLDAPAFDGAHGVLVQAPEGADRVVTVPTVVLRYLLEGWLEELLAATKLLFVPNLTYFVRGTTSGYEEFVSEVPAGRRGDAVAYVLQRLADRARTDAGTLEDYDALVARTAAFPGELRAAGLSDDDVAYLIASGVTPTFLDQAMATGHWRDVAALAAHL